MKKQVKKQVGASLIVSILAAITTWMLVLSAAGAANPSLLKRPLGKGGHPLPRVLATPTSIDFAAGGGESSRALAPDILATATPQDTLLAAHLMRRAGFGPTPKEFTKVAKKGSSGRTNWINAQLNPSGITDTAAEGKLPTINPDNYDYDYLRSWFIRMVYSKRQLQEKMTLILHEHFSISNDKVGEPLHMYQHETLLRSNALGNFQTLLAAIVKDNGMLRWLDNDYNDGNDYSCGPNEDEQCPPNENFGREFMQLYTMGTVLLDISGQHYNNQVIPPYDENDVKALARAFTGWHIDYCNHYPDGCATTGLAEDGLHDSTQKTMFAGAAAAIGDPGYAFTIPSGMTTVNETNFVIDKILNGNQKRKDSIAAFLAKALLVKMANENPSPAYVQTVATALEANAWSLKEGVRAVFTAVDPNTGHPYFEAPENVRTMYKDPIEQFVGSIRALYGNSDGDALINWCYYSGQLIWYPPSVFSFYPPGQKSVLVNTSYVFFRDQAVDEFINFYYDGTTFSTKMLIKKGKLLATNPQGVIDYLANQLLGTPLHSETNSQVLNYINSTSGATLDEHIQGVVYLILISPDFQRN